MTSIGRSLLIMEILKFGVDKINNDKKIRFARIVEAAYALCFPVRTFASPFGAVARFLLIFFLFLAHPLRSYATLFADGERPSLSPA